MKQETTPKSAALTENKNIFEVLASTFDDLPDEMLAELPTDGAENHDHYLYGWPKKSGMEQHETAATE